MIDNSKCCMLLNLSLVTATKTSNVIITVMMQYFRWQDLPTALKSSFAKALSSCGYVAIHFASSQ